MVSGVNDRTVQYGGEALGFFLNVGGIFESVVGGVYAESGVVAEVLQQLSLLAVGMRNWFVVYAVVA